MSAYMFILLIILLALAYSLLSKAIQQRDASFRDEETRMIQEIHHNLLRMEERVEALETILLDRSERTAKSGFRTADRE